MTDSTKGGQRHDRSALILYGSETGNSQDAAEQLGRIVERQRFATNVMDMDSADLTQLLQYTIVILTMSTTGQGDFPANSRKFWKSLLRKRLPLGCLNHVSYTTFGLGDTSYAKFNFAAKKLRKRLDQLGAKQFYPSGEGDEQHEEGIDGVFLPWSLDLKSKLLRDFPLPEGVLPIPDDEFLPPKHILRLDKDLKNPPQTQQNHTTNASLLRPPSIHSTALSQDTTKSRVASTQQSTVNRLTTSKDSSSTRAADSKMLSSSNSENGDVNMSSGQYENAPQLSRSVVPTYQADDDPSSIEVFTGIEDKKAANLCIKDHVDKDDLIVDHDKPSKEFLPIPDAQLARIVVNKRMTSDDHFQDVRLISMNIAASRKRPVLYNPGYIVTIYPKNFPSDVNALIELQNWGDLADEPLHFERSEGCFTNPFFHPQLENWSLPTPCTLRTLLEHNLDITAIPRRIFFEQISYWTDNPTHKERLREFSNPTYTDEFFDYATRPRRSILEILQDFDTVQIPFRYITTIFPLLRGRQFSIATGGSLSESPIILDENDEDTVRIDICVALVKYRTILRKIRQGVCSRYLAALQPGDQIAITVQPGTYPKMVPLIHKPILMIAPGTGVAPMRSLIYERELVQRQLEREFALQSMDSARNNDERRRSSASPPGPPVFGQAMLIFGNRNSKKDFLFSDDFTSAYISEQLKVHTAWSREYPKGDPRNKYVQDVIREQGKWVYQALKEEGGTVFVCGSSGKMPLGVRTAIVDVFREKGEMTQEEAESEVAKLEKTGRYVQETW